ncbi:MAG: hypothetical protein NT090_12160 [Acidobacteria bacterium]|nr:hypothetical protein [Acidobacteriota bacterium]
MGSPWRVDELEIAGYAEVLKETMLPSVVPPVFRLKADPRRSLLPPYSFNGGFVCNAAEVAPRELEALRDAREITLFDDPFPAQHGYELWVDQSFQRHYEHRDQAEANLGRIAAASIGQAEVALREGSLEEAERLAGVAISADDRRVEPLAIKAAIRRLQGNATGESLMAELAAPVLEDRLFSLLVTNYCRTARDVAQDVQPRRSGRPMRDMAKLRPLAVGAD